MSNFVEYIIQTNTYLDITLSWSMLIEWLLHNGCLSGLSCCNPRIRRCLQHKKGFSRSHGNNIYNILTFNKLYRLLPVCMGSNRRLGLIWQRGAIQWLYNTARRFPQSTNPLYFKVRGYVTCVKGWTFKVYSISTKLITDYFSGIKKGVTDILKKL